MTRPRPNILFLMTDQQRWDAMGCSGGWVETPHLDRIAREGVRFTNCVTTSPVCIPARVSMAAGLYPHNTGVRYNRAYTLPPGTPTWMEAIRAAGYRTSLFGKTHLHPQNGDLRDCEPLLHACGLDDVDEIGGPRASARVLSHMTAAWEKHGLWEAYRADFAERFAVKPWLARPSTHPAAWYADVYVGRRAAQYLRDYDRPQPWFCWVSFGGPHEPWDAPEPYAGLYDPAQMPAPAPRPRDHEGRPRGRLDDRLARAPAFDPGDVGAMRANYAGNVTLIDAQIGEILGVIEQRGELDDTAILFTSDHGEMNGDAGLIYKENFLDGAVRVPFLVRTPGTLRSAAAGRTSDAFVEWFDAGPTLAELAGAEITPAQNARSLCPVLSDPAAAHRPFAVSEYRDEIMMLDHDWKTALNRDGRPYLLFDRAHDPGETWNLAGRPETASVEDELRARLLDYVERTRLPFPV